MTGSVKYCEDCKWCRPRGVLVKDYEFATCSSVDANKGASGTFIRSVFAVSRDQKGIHCSNAREYSCGADAKYWEPA